MAANTPDPSGTTPGGGRARIRRPDVRQLLDALQQEAPEQPKLLANSLGIKFALIPAGVFLRGGNLTSGAPSYYSATVTRGATVELSRTVGGVRTVLATVKSASYTSGQWALLSLKATGDRLTQAGAGAGYESDLGVHRT